MWRRSLALVLAAAGGLLVLPAIGGGLGAARADASSPGQSNNWFGYGQNVLAGGTLAHQVSATWHVPAVHQRVAGQAENSAVWTGIGGGCLGQGCTGVADETLIQAGTEQDVAADGTTSYSAWWEAVPAPQVTFAELTIKPGDGIRVTVAEDAPGLWTATIDDVSSGQTRSVTTTVPYPSDYSTAEWVMETPLLLGANSGLASLPAFAPVQFQNAQVNRQPAHLRYPAQAIDLVDSNGSVIASASPPDRRGDRFNACAQATCAPPN